MCKTASQPTSAEPKLGLNILYELDNSEPTVDIVAIHGLDADPEKSWMYKDEDGQRFNWLKDRFGLPTAFPTTRIMQFAYASA
ncbi:hypothetical protein EV127DRAFT_429970 [Xylaria flabelliformis]|nr:hypothetical protein EV127DRAFT_429970 [Xylaria flabelliformis]